MDQIAPHERSGLPMKATMKWQRTTVLAEATMENMLVEGPRTTMKREEKWRDRGNERKRSVGP
jgi:hypothetical protein